MSEKRKRKPLKEWLKKVWTEYLEDCARELKELKEKRSFGKYLTIGPKLLIHTVIYFLFFFVILWSSIFGGIEENDRDID